MKRIIAIIITLCMMGALLAACGTTGTKITSQSPIKAEQKEAGKYPMVVTDATGINTTLAQKPQAIVSIALGSDEVLLSLIDPSRIKSVTTYVDDEGVSSVTEAAKKVPTRTMKETEKVISLQPDLVFVDTWAKKEFVQQLRDANIPVYVYKTPKNVEDVKAFVTSLAKIVDEEAKGAEIIAWMDAKLKAVADKVNTLTPEQKLTVIDYREGNNTSGKGTNFDDAMTRAGLINATAKAGLENWPDLTKEKIVEFNPDIIITPSWMYDKKNKPESMVALIKDDKSLAGVKAVANNRIFTPQYKHLYTVSHFVVLGIEEVAKMAYPELFK